jgi:lysyl-tRNA synthetase class I
VCLTFVPCRTPPPKKNNFAQPEKAPPTETSADQNTNRQLVVYGYYSSSANRQKEYLGHFDERGLDSSAVFQHFYVIIVRRRAGPNRVPRTQCYGLQVEHGRVGRSLQLISPPAELRVVMGPSGAYWGS